MCRRWLCDLMKMEHSQQGSGMAGVEGARGKRRRYGQEVLKARVKNFAFVLITTVGGSRGEGWVGFDLYLERSLCSVKNGLKGPRLEAGKQRLALRVKQ